MMSLRLTREEKENLVVELFRQGMTHAQIAKEAHVSLRDIGPILNKKGEYQSLSNSSQAYKMFSEGSTPIQVAIALNLRENEVNKLYEEYWNLDGMYQLNQIYEETKDDIWSILELHRRMKIERLSPQQVSRILKMTVTLECNNRDLEGEQGRLEVSNKEAAKTFQQLTDLIHKDHKTMEENDYVISQQKREIEHLILEKARVKNSIDSIRLNNEIYTGLKQTVKQEIVKNISQSRHLLRMAIASIFESERKHPGKLRALYYNTFPTLTVEQLIMENQSDPTRFAPSNDSLENLILDEAEQCYNRLVEATINNHINEIPNTPNDTESPTQVLLAPEVQVGLSPVKDSHKIFDSADLSQVNLIYNDITFQIYPDPKITYNQSSNKDELDNISFHNQG